MADGAYWPRLEHRVRHRWSIRGIRSVSRTSASRSMRSVPLVVTPVRCVAEDTELERLTSVPVMLNAERTGRPAMLRLEAA